LRIKESDRLKTVCALFTALGADIQETDDGLRIHGGTPLTGGIADAAGDHRIAMTAAVAAAYCTGPVEVQGAEAVAKSYPGFWEDRSKVTCGF
jgi:3-phosphoshikimate 1-carboxyvinyltransferase